MEETFSVEDLNDGPPLEQDFADVQGLLEDDHGSAASDHEEFAEEDVAEVLAASWREKRQELSRLRKSRQFGRAKDFRRSFRVEVEEMKSKTSCQKCWKRGHWARECPNAKGSGKGQKSAGPAAPATGAAMVLEGKENAPEFVASASHSLCLLDRVRQHVSSSDCSKGLGGRQMIEIALVSCPGYGVLDSGCGRTFVGADTLSEFENLWHQAPQG